MHAFTAVYKVVSVIHVYAHIIIVIFVGVDGPVVLYNVQISCISKIILITFCRELPYMGGLTKNRFSDTKTMEMDSAHIRRYKVFEGGVQGRSWFDG